MTDYYRDGGSKETSNDDENGLYDDFNYNIEIGGTPPGTAAIGGKQPTVMPSYLDTKDNEEFVRMATAARPIVNEDTRPMTSVRGVGYKAMGQKSKQTFDPFNQGTDGPAPPLAEIEENGSEAKANVMERDVHRIVRETAKLLLKGKNEQALRKAKEGIKKERSLNKFRESAGLVDSINLELTYCVCFVLATAYEKSGMVDEALNTYSLIVRNKQYAHAGRLRVNMGNIYFNQEKFMQAIKMYRMALDQIPSTQREVQFRIQRNIGNAFVRLGQFQNAIQSYERVQEVQADVQAAFNLVLCFFAMGDCERMRSSFKKLVAIPIEDPVGDSAHVVSGVDADSSDDDDDGDDDDDHDLRRRRYFESGTLETELESRRMRATEYITTAARLIAPVIEKESWIEGYEWIVKTLEKSQHSKIGSEMTIAKSLQYLKEKRFKEAIDVLKGFEKKEKDLMARAANNLSFLYFLEGDVEQADKYANVAVRTDRYNARALVNKGNCLYAAGELERAKELYLESIGVDASCAEAIYNLGLVNKRMGNHSEALQAFEKLHTLIPSSPEVLYQIASLHDLLGDYRQAIKWFNILITRVPTDPDVLSRIGQIHNKDNNETQAYHYQMDSYKYYPVNLDVISWLGVWFVKSEFYEKAITFFQRAAEIQPDEVKWRLMVASCYRRMGSYQKALDLYESIYRDYPDNLECLRYLVAISKDMGLKYDHFQRALGALERQNVQSRIISSSSTATGGERRFTSNTTQHHTEQQQQQRRDLYTVDQTDEDSHSTGVESPKSPVRDDSMDWGDEDLDELLGD